MAVQAELAAAKKFEGETIKKFADKPVGGGDGDIDFVTNIRSYEVKAGNPANLVKGPDDVRKLKNQMVRLAEHAKANGTTPVVAFKDQYRQLPEEVQNILNMFGVIPDFY